MGYEWDMNGIWMGYEWNMNGIWMGYEWDMNGIIWMGFFQLLGYEWTMNGMEKWLEENGKKWESLSIDPLSVGWLWDVLMEHWIYIYLGKLSYFTNLNLKAIKGGDFPVKTHGFPGFRRTGWGRDEIYPEDMSKDRIFWKKKTSFSLAAKHFCVWVINCSCSNVLWDISWMFMRFNGTILVCFMGYWR